MSLVLYLSAGPPAPRLATFTRLRAVPVALLLTLAAAPAAHQITVEPFLPISVWYPSSADVDDLKRDFAVIRNAGFNAVTTWITWQDGEPRRGAYNLLELDRVIAVASEAGLEVQVEVHTEPQPSWVADGTTALAGQFYEYVRRRVAGNPVVISVSHSAAAGSSALDRVTVGRSAGSLTPRQARKALWSAIARGSRRFGFVDPDSPVSPAVLALGETVGVITRNPALFAPLEPRTLREGEVTITGGDRVSVHILESADAVAIIGVNHATEVRKVTITFRPEIPEAIWQNMEEGIAVHFVMGGKGPFLEHTFAPEDVLVLAIRKKLTQSGGLERRFTEIASAAQGKVGAAVLVLESGERAELNAAERFPMQSVYKLPIGMAVLDRIDKGALRLEQKVRVSPADFVSAGQYSPIRDRFPKGTDLTVRQLLEFTLAHSDGTGSDVLLRLAGGADGVMRYLHALGVHEVIVATTEKAMGLGDQTVQYRNWSTPRGMIAVLKAVHEGRGLSPVSRELLLSWMKKVTRGEARIKGLLPAGTVAARRTGSSGTHAGFTAATNDVGIVTLPNGRHLAIAVFVSDSRADDATRERVIAEIARSAWDRWGR